MWTITWCGPDWADDDEWLPFAGQREVVSEDEAKRVVVGLEREGWIVDVEYNPDTTPDR